MYLDGRTDLTKEYRTRSEKKAFLAALIFLYRVLLSINIRYDHSKVFILSDTSRGSYHAESRIGCFCSVFSLPKLLRYLRS